jgi:hypothetical protein
MSGTETAGYMLAVVQRSNQSVTACIFSQTKRNDRKRGANGSSTAKPLLATHPRASLSSNATHDRLGWTVDTRISFPLSKN